MLSLTNVCLDYTHIAILKFPGILTGSQFMSSGVEDKLGEEINVGDEVSTRMRGGKRTGPVVDITLMKQEAEEKSIKNPPKITLKDQHG